MEFGFKHYEFENSYRIVSWERVGRHQCGKDLWSTQRLRGVTTCHPYPVVVDVKRWESKT